MRAAEKNSDFVEIFGSPVSTQPSEVILASLEQSLLAQRQTLLSYINVHVCMTARNEPRLNSVLHRSDYVLADGIPIVWFVRWKYGIRLRKTAVSDFLPGIFEIAAKRNQSVLILGASDEARNQLAQLCRETFPKLRLRTESFDLRCDSHEDKAAIIAREQCDILLLCFGVPAQEIFYQRFADTISSRLVIMCGNAVEVLSGVKNRAPVWMRVSGVEWVWRLAHDPRRLFGRYFRTNAAFALLIIQEFLRSLAVRREETRNSNPSHR